MFLPRYSTRSVLIILAVAGLLFAVLSQGIGAIADRWEPPGSTVEPISAWRQACAAVSVAVIGLALLMVVNAMFFLIGWVFSFVAWRTSTEQAAAEPAAAQPANLVEDQA